MVYGVRVAVANRNQPTFLRVATENEDAVAAAADVVKVHGDDGDAAAVADDDYCLR